MSFAQGRATLAIPGPSPVPDRVLRAMHRAAPDIYGEALAAENRTMIAGLKRLAGTDAHLAPYIGNGHAGWEAANLNLFNRGDRALVLTSGHFGRAWAENAADVGIVVETLDFGLMPPDPQRLADRLARDGAHDIKAVLVCQVDTASSARADIPALRAAMGEHPACFAVDAIASLGCEPMRMDDWGVDVAFAASQKGLMMPPGMGFVWFSEKARAAGRGAGLRTPYWDWTPRADGPEFWQYWQGTAPTHHLFGLREALDMILHEEGLPQVWARHDTLAHAVWAAVAAWGQGHERIALNMADPGERARAVTAARFGAPDATRLRQWCEQKAGVTLGIGLGMATPEDPQASGALRVAHMGHVNAHMTLGVLAVMEAGLMALSIPHGTGALEAAASVVAARA